MLRDRFESERVTYVGPRAFVAAFALICVVFGSAGYFLPSIVGLIDTMSAAPLTDIANTPVTSASPVVSPVASVEATPTIVLPRIAGVPRVTIPPPPLRHAAIPRAAVVVHAAMSRAIGAVVRRPIVSPVHTASLIGARPRVIASAHGKRGVALRNRRNIVATRVLSAAALVPHGASEMLVRLRPAGPARAGALAPLTTSSSMMVSPTRLRGASGA